LREEENEERKKKEPQQTNVLENEIKKVKYM